MISGPSVAQNYNALYGTSSEDSEESSGEATGNADTVEAANDGSESTTAAQYGALAAQSDGGEATPNNPSLDAYSQVAETFQEPTAIEMTRQRVDIFRQKLKRVIGAVPTYFTQIGDALALQAPNGEPTYFIGVLIFVSLLLGIGRSVAMLYGVFIALPVMRRIQKPNPQGIVDKLPVLSARVGMQLAGMAIALTTAGMVAAGFYQEHEATLTTVILIVGTYVLVQVIDVCWRMVMSPFLPDYRIPTLSNTDARKLYRWMAFGSMFGVTSSAFVGWLDEMGVNEEIIAITMITTTFTSVLIIISGLRACGGAITNALLGGEPRSEATWVAAAASFLWRPLLLIYLIFAFLEMSFRLIMGLELNIPLLGGMFMTILAVLIVYSVTVYIIERLFTRSRRIRELNHTGEFAETIDEEGMSADQMAIRDALADVDEEGGAGPVAMAPAPTAKRQSMRTFEDLANRIASLFAVYAGGWALIMIWGGEEIYAEGTPMGVLTSLLDVAFLGYVIFHGARIWMDQKIEEEGGPEAEPEPGDEGGGGAAASRLGTLLPLFRTFVLLVIAVTSVLLIMMEVGVNVAPLFAGAGVVGLAIGFGAQSLVRDILSGIFFLSDDAFRKGEYIDVGEVKGTVEKISLRSFQLRHHLGALNTIPFGEIKHLTNYSRDWVMMKLPLRLTYDTDVDKVRKLVKKLGVKLLDHETEGHKFVQPLKSQGVYMMEDSAMIFRVKFMTRPGDQWTTRKLVYTEIRKLFKEHDIKFAHKEVTVRIPEIENRNADNLTEEEKRAIGAAARRAVEEQDAGMKPPADDR
ncbi:MAG: mechanosensitive ion channel family protein [Pikeienuella sp.]